MHTIRSALRLCLARSMSRSALNRFSSCAINLFSSRSCSRCCASDSACRNTQEEAMPVWMTPERQGKEKLSTKQAMPVPFAFPIIINYPKDNFVFYFVPPFFESSIPPGFPPQSRHRFLGHTHTRMAKFMSRKPDHETSCNCSPHE